MSIQLPGTARRRRLEAPRCIPVLAAGALLAAATLLAPASARAHEPGEEDHPPARTAPVLVERAEPVYPEAARKDGIGGTVSLEITVAADGTTSSITVKKGAGFGLDEAALEAARKFKFRPATEGGKPIASIVLFDQSFTVKSHLSAETSAEPPPLAEEARDQQASPPPAEAPRYESVVSGRGPTSAASASSVRNLDFDLRPKTSPNDILRVVPGLLAVQHQGGGKADQLFLRGFDADHGTDVGVFIDGVPVNMPSHAHGQGFADLHWLIPEAIERIDVQKGPYDVRYGDFSTAGAINLITRKTFDESSLQLSLGGFPGQGCKHLDWNVAGGATDCKLLATERFVGVAAPRLTGWAEKLHPWIAFEAAHDDGPFDNPERLSRYNLFSKVSYDVAPGTSLGVFFQAYGSQWIGSGQIPAREVEAGRLSQFGALDPSEGGLTERQMLTAFIKHKSGDSELNATAYVTRYKLALWNDFTFFLNNPDSGSLLEQDDSRTVSGLRVSYHFHRHVGPVSFRTTLGAEARHDDIHIDRWDAESCGVNGAPAASCPGNDFRKRLGRLSQNGTPVFGSNNDISQLNVAGYVEEDAVFGRHFRLVAGLRADYFGFNVSDNGETLGVLPAGGVPTSGTAQKGVLSPKLTAVITPLPGLLDLYLNYGSGFHSNMAQVALRDGAVLPGTTTPVRAVPALYGGEVGARARLFDRLDLAAALWVSYLESETVFSADAGTYEPSDATLRIGVDVEARARILDWLFVDFDLAQSDAQARRNGGNDGAVALAPRLYMTGGVTVKHPVGVRGGLRFRYLGDRPAYDERSDEYKTYGLKTLADGAPNPSYNPSRVMAPGYLVFDLYGAYRYRWFEASVSIQNLLNTTWREAQFGNQSCTRDETTNAANPSYSACGRMLTADARTGVTDVHFTPGVPFNLQLTLKAYF